MPRSGLADTQRAKEAWGMANDGILKGLSVGFASLEARNNKGTRTHTKARLMETSLVTFPAYPTAGVLAVRQEERMEEPTSEEIVEEVVTETVDLAPLEARMEEHTTEMREVRNQIANIITDVPVAGTAHVAPCSVRCSPENGGGGSEYQNRALADVIGTSSR